MRGRVLWDAGSERISTENWSDGTQCEMQPLPAGAGAPARRQVVAREKVLVIDDNHEISTLLSECILGPAGYETAIAKDGIEGLDKIRSENPDLILLDLEMPRLGGLGVLEVLQAERRTAPIVLMTSHGSEALAVTVFRKGVKDYVIKPIDAEELLGVVERALTEARLRREKEHLIEDLRTTNQELERRVSELNALYGIGRSVTAVLELDRLLSRIVEAAVYITGAEEGSLLLLDEDSNELFVRAAQGLDEKYARDFRLKVQDSLAGKVLRTGEPMVINRAGGLHKVKTAYLVNSILYVPLKSKGHVVGVLTVDNRVSVEDFTRNDLFLLSLLSDYAAVAIENARLFGQVETERRTLEAVLSGTEDMIIVTDEHDRVMLINEAARMGFDVVLDSVEGRPLFDVIRNEDLAGLYRQGLSRANGNHAEISVGVDRTLLATLSPLAGIGRVAVMKDITSLKQLDQMKSDFVSAVSHDLRSPLTTIQGFVDLLPAAGELSDQQRTFLTKINRGIQDIADLIDDLLDIGRIEAGMDWGTEPCELSDIIITVVERFQHHAETRGQMLTMESSSEPLMVQGNRLRLEQVLGNLIGNAIKYSPDGGEISVTGAVDGAFAIVSVEDNGIGIPLTEQPFIFDKFYRVQNDETAGIGGTGLGLSIVKSIIDKHDGRIWVQSEPGAGSRFSFLLPVIQMEGQA